MSTWFHELSECSITRWKQIETIWSISFFFQVRRTSIWQWQADIYCKYWHPTSLMDSVPRIPRNFFPPKLDCFTENEPPPWLQIQFAWFANLQTRWRNWHGDKTRYFNDSTSSFASTIHAMARLKFLDNSAMWLGCHRCSFTHDHRYHHHHLLPPVVGLPLWLLESNCPSPNVAPPLCWGLCGNSGRRYHSHVMCVTIDLSPPWIEATPVHTALRWRGKNNPE